MTEKTEKRILADVSVQNGKYEFSFDFETPMEGLVLVGMLEKLKIEVLSAAYNLQKQKDAKPPGEPPPKEE